MAIAIIILLIILFGTSWGIYAKVHDNLEIRHTSEDDGGQCARKMRTEHSGNIFLYKFDKSSCNAICYDDPDGLCRTAWKGCEACTYCVGQNCSGICTTAEDCPEHTFSDEALSLLGMAEDDGDSLEYEVNCVANVCVYGLSQTTLDAATLPDLGDEGNVKYCGRLINQTDPVTTAGSCIDHTAQRLNDTFGNCNHTYACANDANVPTYEEVAALDSAATPLGSFIVSLFSFIVETWRHVTVF
jgi:hypothetical protein